MKRTQTLLNKPAYLGLSILEMSKTVMYEFWYDYVKPKYKEKAKLCYMDTDSFLVYIKQKKQGLNQIMNQTDHYLKEKIIGLMKNELGGKILTELALQAPKHIAI